MRLFQHLRCFAACSVLFASATLVHGQSATTGVDVGAGFASAHGAAQGAWKLVDTKSHVGGAGSIGRALAVGVGPGGVSLSHSIGLGGGPAAAGHNFNLSVGPGGSHVSHGGVVAQGGPTRVIASGQTQVSPRQHRHAPHNWHGPPVGGTSVTGFGRHVRAYSQSQAHPFNSARGAARFGAPFRPFPF